MSATPAFAEDRVKIGDQRLTLTLADLVPVYAAAASGCMGDSRHCEAFGNLADVYRRAGVCDSADLGNHPDLVELCIE